MFSCTLLTLLCALPSLGYMKFRANTYHILSDGFMPWMFIHAPLPPRVQALTTLTGQFKAARNAKHCPNPPKFLLVHTKADLRHSDVNDLAYRLQVNDTKPVWFPLPSLWMVNTNSVSPAFLSSFKQGPKMKTASAFLWKTPQFHCKASPFMFTVFPYFLTTKTESNVNFIPPYLSLSKHIYLQGGDVQLEWELKRSNLNMWGRSCRREMGK